MHYYGGTFRSTLPIHQQGFGEQNWISGVYYLETKKSKVVENTAARTVLTVIKLRNSLLQKKVLQQPFRTKASHISIFS